MRRIIEATLFLVMVAFLAFAAWPLMPASWGNWRHAVNVILAALFVALFDRISERRNRHKSSSGDSPVGEQFSNHPIDRR